MKKTVRTMAALLGLSLTFALTATANAKNCKNETLKGGSSADIIPYAGENKTIGKTYNFSTYSYTVYSREVVFDDDIIRGDVVKNYGSKKDFKYVGYAYKCLMSDNLSQSYMNSQYESETGTHIDNSCSVVASTIMLRDFNGISGVNTNHESDEQIFNTSMDTALSNKYNKPTSGMTNDNIAKLMTKMFNYYGSTLKGKAGDSKVYSTLENEIMNGRVAQFGQPTHSTTCVGYLTAEYTYTKTTGALWWKSTKTVTEEVDYLVINDGWSTNYDYSLFPVSCIGSCDFVKAY